MKKTWCASDMAALGVSVCVWVSWCVCSAVTVAASAIIRGCCRCCCCHYLPVTTALSPSPRAPTPIPRLEHTTPPPPRRYSHPSLQIIPLLPAICHFETFSHDAIMIIVALVGRRWLSSNDRYFGHPGKVYQAPTLSSARSPAWHRAVWRGVWRAAVEG